MSALVIPGLDKLWPGKNECHRPLHMIYIHTVQGTNKNSILNGLENWKLNRIMDAVQMSYKYNVYVQAGIPDRYFE